MRPKCPFNVVDGIQVDFHESPNEIVAAFTQIQLISNALIIRCIELWKVVFLEVGECFPTFVFVGADVDAVMEIIGTSRTECEPSEQYFEIGRECQMGGFPEIVRLAKEFVTIVGFACPKEVKPNIPTEFWVELSRKAETQRVADEKRGFVGQLAV